MPRSSPVKRANNNAVRIIHMFITNTAAPCMRLYHGNWLPYFGSQSIFFLLYEALCFITLSIINAALDALVPVVSISMPFASYAIMPSISESTFSLTFLAPQPFFSKRRLRAAGFARRTNFNLELQKCERWLSRTRFPLNFLDKRKSFSVSIILLFLFLSTPLRRSEE